MTRDTDLEDRETLSVKFPDGWRDFVYVGDLDDDTELPGEVVNLQLFGESQKFAHIGGGELPDELPSEATVWGDWP